MEHYVLPNLLSFGTFSLFDHLAGCDFSMLSQPELSLSQMPSHVCKAVEAAFSSTRQSFIGCPNENLRSSCAMQTHYISRHGNKFNGSLRHSRDYRTYNGEYIERLPPTFEVLWIRKSLPIVYTASLKLQKWRLVHKMFPCAKSG